MNSNRDRRLAKLEQHRRPAARILYVWRNAPMESAEEAIARRFPAGVPAGAHLVICSWQVAGERSCSGVDAEQADALPMNLDCVAVDDRGLPD
jgi:hypothetical protein